MKALDEIYDCIYSRPFADDDTLLNDFAEDVLRRTSWKLFRNQEQFCYMIDEKNPPQLKPEAINIIRNCIKGELMPLVEHILIQQLMWYRAGNVDLGDEGDLYLQEALDDEYPEFETAMREHVYNDYVNGLGRKRAREYFENIGREDWIIE